MKLRGRRRYYRAKRREIANFRHRLAEAESWYDMWHIHLDWKGITENARDRRSHFRLYMELLRTVAASGLSGANPFQAWIYVDGEASVRDALFLHTANPQGRFPFVNSRIRWLHEERELPAYLRGLVAWDAFAAGEYRHVDGRVDYFIEMKGVGLGLNAEV